VSAAFYSLAEALEVMRRDADVGGGADPAIPTSAPEVQETSANGGDSASTGAGIDRDLLTQMIQTLLQEADTPPREVEGVSEEFCDSMIYLPSLVTHPLNQGEPMKKN
jgi:hypothetical protein